LGGDLVVRMQDRLVEGFERSTCVNEAGIKNK